MPITEEDVLEAQWQGWTIENGQLIMPDDESRYWAATWIPVRVLGKTIQVPNWLKRRMEELRCEEEL